MYTFRSRTRTLGSPDPAVTVWHGPDAHHHTPVPAKNAGILIARAIVQGDVQAARIIRAGSPPTWSASTQRAIVGAIRYARDRYGVSLDPHAFW